MAFFNEAFYSPHSSPSSQPTPRPSHTELLDLEIEQTLDDTIDFLSSSDVEKLLSSSPRTHTPQIHRSIDTPPSSVTPKPTASPTLKPKRVDFAPFTSTNWGWAASAGPDVQKENTSASLLRKLQPSKERSKLRSKSILKATGNRENEQSASPEMPLTSNSWPQVLDSGLKQLRSDQPGMRLDAWRVMQQFLASPPVIDSSEELGERHNALLSCAVRDLTYSGSDQAGGLPNQLPNFALKFLSRFIQLPAELSATLLASLINTTIEQLGRDDMPKNLRRCYMDFLYQQNLGSDVMTSSRARKLVEVIHATGQRQTSSGTLLNEIKLCRKLVDQVPEGMIASASSWLDIFYCSLQADEFAVFRTAVDAIFEIGAKLGHRIEVSKAFQRLLATSANEKTGLSKLQHLQNEMKQRSDFALNSTQAALIPKLFSAIVLLLRAKTPSAVLQGNTRFMKSLLHPYFLKSTVSAQSLAWTAWCCVIIAELHGGRWPEETRASFRSPMDPILIKSTTEVDFEKHTPAYVLSTYLVLLYCSFAPDSNPQDLKPKWEMYVADVIGPMVLSQSTSHVHLACRIICSLLSSETQWDPQIFLQARKPWNSPVLKINELARIDVSWVRLNLDCVLRLLDKFFKSPRRAEHSVLVFRALLDAVAQAGANEVIATKEAKEAVARITSYLNHLWAPYSRKAKDIVLFGQLIDELFDEPSRVHSGGRMIFTENILRKASHGDHFEVATTPSHRSSSTSQPTSAIAHLLDLITKELIEQHPRSELSQLQDDEPLVLFDLIKQLTTRVCLAEATLAGKITVLCNNVRRLLKLKKDSGVSYGRAYVDALCHHGLVFVTDLITTPENYGHEAMDPLEQAYQHLTEMISDISCHSTGISNDLTVCYQAILNKASSELGAAGALVFVAEASARGIHNFLRNKELTLHDSVAQDSTVVKLAETIVSTMPLAVPSTEIRRLLERSAGGRYPPVAKKCDLHEVYHMSNHVIQFEYGHPHRQDNAIYSMTALIRALGNVLASQRVAATNHIRIMQAGIARIVQDKQGRIFGADETESYSNTIYALWQTVCGKIFEHVDQAFLSSFDELISAGLNSRSFRVANETVIAWNKSFGLQNDLDYPARTAKALRKLRTLDVDLQVASMLPPGDHNVPDSPLIIESTEMAVHARTVPAPPTPKHVQRISQLSVSPMPTTMQPRRTASATPRSKPKPRHEDSQLHFEPIPSSPLPQPEPDVLTEHQKEVAERQREGESIFAEISSPGASRMRQLSEGLPDEGETVPTPSTPVLGATIDDAIPSSSPVVASVKRRKSVVRRVAPSELDLNPVAPNAQDEVPSSPPAVIEENPIPELDISSGPVVASSRAELLKRKRQNLVAGLLKLQSSQSIPEKDTIAPAELLPSEDKSFDIAMSPQIPQFQHTIPSTVAAETQSFHSILSNPTTLTGSSETRVQESFVTPFSENAQGVLEDEPLSRHPVEDIQVATQLESSQAIDPSRKKRKRGRNSFASTKRRKTAESFAYNTTEFIKFTPKLPFAPSDDMLPVIVVKVPGEATPELHTVGSEIHEEDIQGTATAKRGRSRRRKLQGQLVHASSQSSQGNVISRKRGRASFEFQDLESVEDTNRKRAKASPKTPTSRSRSASSVHYVEITPGDATGRQRGRSMGTDTPEAEAIVSQSQQAANVSETGPEEYSILMGTSIGVASADTRHADLQSTHALNLIPSAAPDSSAADDGSDVPRDQIENGQETPRAEAEDEMFSPASTRRASPAPSVAISFASSQASQSSQMSAFSVSAFKGVMSRFVDQIKDLMKGGSWQETEVAAQRMADEATKTVEKLAKGSKKN